MSASADYRRELDEYLDVHHRLYRAVAAVSGAEVVVDASKSTAQLFALRRIRGLDLRVVNLVRDSRGVANSWNKSGIVKPQSTDGALMGTYAPHRLAVLWAALQLECAVLRAAAPHSARVRYEDLVAAPRPTLERALREVGLPPACGRTGARRRAAACTSPPATASPAAATRFTAGRIELRARRRLAVDPSGRRPPRGHRGDAAPARRLRLRRPPSPRRTRPGPPDGDSPPACCWPAPAPAAPPAPRFLKPGWPLAVLYVGFPLWWALGLAQIIFFAVAIAMAVILRKKKEPLRVPRGFSLWLLFLIWMFAGVLMIRADAPMTLPGGGIGRVFDFGVWAGWYLAITVAMLYVANTARELPTQRIVRLLAWMFVVTAGFGVLAVVAPTLEFESPMEMVLPRSVVSTNFVRTLIHPSLASSSDFLGYVQPRPTAPFPYSNAWGNNLALYLPFFMLACFGKGAGWRKKVGPAGAGRRVFPIIFSLNRGLWISLAFAAIYAAIRLAVNGKTRALQALVAALRGRRHRASCPRRSTTPSCCGSRPRTATTAVPAPPRRWSPSPRQGSPFVGLRHHPHHDGHLQLAGRWRDRGVPPVRGSAARDPGLHVAAGAHHRIRGHRRSASGSSRSPFLRRARGPSPLDIACCTVLLDAVLCFFVYDSLGSAMFTAMIAIGLMARADLPAQLPKEVAA